jgi:hypothetical protein
VEFMRCSEALALSQEAGDPYSGDCPWPKKPLSEQRSTSTAEDKGWIQTSIAAAGFGVGGTPAGKNDILTNCCPDHDNRFPLCRGSQIGSYGVRGADQNTPCGSITKEQWQRQGQEDRCPSCAQNLIYSNGRVRMRASQVTDNRGLGPNGTSNPLTTAQIQRLRIQCLRGDSPGDGDDDPLGALEGPLCYK